MTVTTKPESFDEFLNSLHARGSSPATVRAYASDLSEFFQWMESNPIIVSLENSAAQWLTANKSIWSPATTKRRLAALRSYAKHTHSEVWLSDYRCPTPARGVAHPCPRGMDDVEAIYQSCKRSHHRVLVMLCGRMGLRVSEAIHVRKKDLRRMSASTAPEQRFTLEVHGKGSKVRLVPVPADIVARLLALTVGKYDNDVLVPIDERSARRAITSAAKRAGVGHVASHDLRMTFGTSVYSKTRDIRVTQELLGHATSRTTEVYTAISETRMREAVDL